MRTKTLLIAASVALAAGIVSTQAQVYSQNIVGYVNTPLAVGFNNVANPFDAAGTSGVNNNLTNLISTYSGNYDGDIVYVWAGTSYTVYTIDSSWPTSIGNAADTAAATPPVINPGASILLDNTISSNTVTFVGTVHVDGAATGTNTIGTTTNILTSSPVLNYYASKLPVGGGISSVLQLPAGGVLDGCVIYVPKIVGGNVTGFNQVTIDSSWPSGFGNAADTAAVVEPQIPVGTGFFFDNTLGAPATWVQSY